MTLIQAIIVFVLALFVGLEVISKVPAILHTPLMSGCNAISGITIIGAIGAAALPGVLGATLGLLAVVAATIIDGSSRAVTLLSSEDTKCILSGFTITGRLLN